ncbi:MAG: DUF4345 domain-containing protein [Trueperaceae bacterium]|nr:MAG: DUF4345 domain-containing protein [Trueperaceae bacterium]
MTLRTQLAYAAAVLTLVVGLLALVNPMLAARLLGLEVVSPRGLSELRSGYGALTLALAGLMLWAVPLRPKAAPLLRTLAVIVAAAALGRLASIAIDGVFGLMNLLFLVLQSAVAGSLLWASGEKPPSKRERQARRETAAARDEAASARIAALEAQRDGRTPPEEPVRQARPEADRS